MTDDKLRQAYWHIAHEMLDYLYSCADKRIVPLRHDANVFNARLNAARRNIKEKK